MSASTFIPYVVPFFAALVATLVLTPIVREVNRRLGMVDKPDPRRINKVPIPRGGGIAVFIGVVGTFAICRALGYTVCMPYVHEGSFFKFASLSGFLVLVGLADDRFGLPPKVKLAGQLVVAFGAWAWLGVGFKNVFPSLPVWGDCAFSVFWIVGAINAFNLIDGLDGLASGLAFIAAIGMAGAHVFSGAYEASCYYLAFAGGLLGFLRYNYNPASIFLGDSGSMFIGFTLSVLPLAYHGEGAFLVSFCVPLLAMGVPVFDTTLAILRRSIRHMLMRSDGQNVGNDKVMTADTDHLHHRILRATGLSQRRTAWTLYALAIFLVAVGLVAMSLQSRTGGLWLAMIAVVSVIVFRNMARVELFDAGRLLGSVAHARRVVSRRRIARFAVPITLLYDLASLAAAFSLLPLLFAVHKAGPHAFFTAAIIRIASTFFLLVFLRTYRTIWSRALLSNYMRLFIASFLGAATSGAILYFTFGEGIRQAFVSAFLFANFSFLFMSAGRLVRSIVRDVFYEIDCTMLSETKSVSRLLVYGGGLRYRAFRRELVRSASHNNRLIVGIIDDDILLRNHYIGGVKVFGTLAQAPEIIRATRADAIVIACDVDDNWTEVIRKMLAPTGVRVTRFAFTEESVL